MGESLPGLVQYATTQAMIPSAMDVADKLKGPGCAWGLTKMTTLRQLSIQY